MIILVSLQLPDNWETDDKLGGLTIVWDEFIHSITKIELHHYLSVNKNGGFTMHKSSARCGLPFARSR